MLEKLVIYGCIMDHSMDDKDATRKVGTCSVACG